MFKDTTIRKRVMAVVDSRISSAQKTYEEKSLVMDEKLQQNIQTLYDERDKNGEKLVEDLVNQVLGL